MQLNVRAPEANKTNVPASARINAIELVTKVLQQLSGHATVSWEFDEILGVIGGGMSVDRVYVFENGFEPRTGNLFASQRAEWRARDVDQEPGNPPLQEIPYEVMGRRWLEELSSGRSVQATAATFTDEERALLEPRGIKSSLIVPLMIGGVWWGVIGCDQCSHPREWDDDAVRLLEICGSVIASQIDRQRLRMGLEKAERRSRFAMQVTGVSVWDGDLHSGEMFISAELKDALGFADEAVENSIRSFQGLVHPDDRARIGAAFKAITAGETGSFEIEHRMLTKGGETRWFLSRGSAILDANGNPARLIGTSTDVTGRKHSETAFRAIFEGSPDGMFLVNIADDGASWTIADCNGRAAAMYGCTREEMRGTAVSDYIVNPPDAKTFSQLVARMRELGPVGGEAIHVRKDGSTFWCGFNQTILNIDGRAQILVVSHDITDQRKHENERLRASKLEALGLLAGGIAHDFNNVLTAITGNLSLVRMDLPEDTPVKYLLDRIEAAGGRARELAAQLLTFARGGVPVTRVTSLANTINAMAHFSSRGSRSKVEVRIAPDSPEVEADEGQIGQVLQNMLINADQAMPDGGVILVSVDRLDSTPDASDASGPWLRIRVKDNGAGIPEEICERIFDPYFSTKARGSGLGLATAYSVIHQHGGSITVSSEVGVGTEFTILLPASSKTSASTTGRTRVAPARGKRILVMDDEDVIRTLARQGLARFGYEVTAVKDGDEAVSVYEEAMQRGKPFAGVVLDMVIPGGMGGERTIEKLREVDPGVRALAMSGYSTSGVIGNPTAFGFKAGLAKPFTLDEFAAAVGSVLEG